MTDEAPQTRYQRDKIKKQSVERHSKITGRLSAGIKEEFEEALVEYNPACRRAGLPSKWTDWDPDPENREDYETDIPTAEEAKALCEGCPLLAGGLCYDYARATSIQHGIWGGVRIVNGVRYGWGQSQAPGGNA